MPESVRLVCDPQSPGTALEIARAIIAAEDIFIREMAAGRPKIFYKWLGRTHHVKRGELRWLVLRHAMFVTHTAKGDKYVLPSGGLLSLIKEALIQEMTPRDILSEQNKSEFAKAKIPDLFLWLHAAYGCNTFTARAINDRLIHGIWNGSGTEISYEMRCAAAESVNALLKGKELSSIGIGKLLSNYTSFEAVGFKLTPIGGYGGVNQWRLDKVKDG